MTTQRLNLTDVRLALLSLVEDLRHEPPQMDDIDSYESHLDGLLRLFVRDGNHIGAEKMDMLKTACVASYKIGYLRGLKNSK